MTDTSPEAVERLRGEVMTLEHLGGTWVTAEDYLALAAKLAEAEAALATAREDALRRLAADRDALQTLVYHLTRGAACSQGEWETLADDIAEGILALIEMKP